MRDKPLAKSHSLINVVKEGGETILAKYVEKLTDSVIKIHRRTHADEKPYLGKSIWK